MSDAQAEIASLRAELKKLKQQTSFAPPAYVPDGDAERPSSNFEEAETRRKTAAEALDNANKRLHVCKKELDDAVTKYRLLARDTARSRDADKDTHSVHVAAIDKLKDDHSKLGDTHDSEVGIHSKKIGFLTHECAIKVRSYEIY